MNLITKDILHTYTLDLEDRVNVLEDTGGSGVNVTALEDRVEVLEITATYHAHRLTTAEQYIDGNIPELIQFEFSEKQALKIF